MSLKVVNKSNSRILDYVHRPIFNSGFYPPVVLNPIALVDPTTGAAWVTPDGLMLVTMQEAV